MAALILLYPCLAWGAKLDQPSRAVSARCETAIHAAERGFGIPNRFLSAIATIESGRAEPKTGLIRPWPWTINAAGTQHFYPGKAQAIAAARAFRARGIRSIDVGCMQINLLAHKDAFRSLSQAFDPTANALYGGYFLTALFHHTGSWPNAAARYHSRTPAIAAAYKGRVLAAWAGLRQRTAESETTGRLIDVAWSLPLATPTATMAREPETWPPSQPLFPAALRQLIPPAPDSGLAPSVATIRRRTHIAPRNPKPRGAQ